MAPPHRFWFLNLAAGPYFGLPRSTLLHCDRIGMLKPSRRIGPNYRVYTRADPKRLEQRWRYRRKGMFLATTNAGIKR